MKLRMILKKIVALVAYCSTRWTMRIRPLRVVAAQYGTLMTFFEEQASSSSTDASASAKASGFLKHMETFEFMFMLTMIIEIFQKIENLNAALQNSQLSSFDSFEKVDAVSYSLQLSRDEKFEKIWNEANESVKKFDIKELNCRDEKEFLSV
ncbi:uncharacterized protein LOC122320307 [Drosophila ficusphila]|uniref:uncharacterized protein LOC122320307 n=1 Tax=Drosophila ficusphila TaxID=30025 RepID=UPI001C89D5D9|nr:uncharacterized protein LOC122320307 [Drosophila ficusphila]